VVVIELLLYLYAESPVHAGAADSLGMLDLPVQREATTGYPVIWGQSLKGALRQAAGEAGAARGWGPATLTEVFGSAPVGPDERGRESSAGALAVGDAQLVAMPVPTLQRTFAWATSELALGRLARKYAALLRGGAAVATATVSPPPERIPAVADGQGMAASGEWAKGGSHAEVLGPCLVEFGEQPNQDLVAWANRLASDAVGDEPLFAPFAGKLRQDLLLVGSDVMPALLRECTELTARVQLGDHKTVQNGPFYSEYLPAETILAAALSLRETDRAGAHLAALTTLLQGSLLQVGGDETLGKGLVWTRFVGGNK
jgi:CRISPR-associated protein Cmr4